ncbi:hypothetical protein DWB61_05985 [Ancylomarina euxinus]|uniref:Uncharacterized protein n=1 Tax=Ancylomarina euxinus TaxID=2283627 RepID=A0A425Y3X1_9BACT|nr:hypothetical protein DWB61_05985 [Ancylomarina euxinus]
MLKCGRVIFEQVLNFPVLLKLSLNEKDLKEMPYFLDLKKEPFVPILSLIVRIVMKYKALTKMFRTGLIQSLYYSKFTI